MSTIQAELLIKNCYVITMNEAGDCFEHGAIAVIGNKIAAVGTDDELSRRFDAAQVIDARGGIVHPGFIDTHVHFMNTARGAFPDTLPTSDMMNSLRRWWDATQEEDERAATYLNCLEMLSNGTTCFLEAGTLQYPDASADAAESVGIRGFIGDPFLWDLPASPDTFSMPRVPRNLDRSLQLLGGQLKRNKGEPLIRGCIALFGLGSASVELMKAAKNMADSHSVIFTQHQSYDYSDAEADAARLGARALCHYADHGIIGENCTFSHMNDLSCDEVVAAHRAGMSAVWCPATSMNLGTSAARHARHLEMLRMGVNISLASDGVSSGCRYDIGLQGLLALLSSRSRAEDRSIISAYDVLELSTIRGAKAVGMAEEIGSIEVGKFADLVIRSTDLPEAQPYSDPIQSLVYNCGSKSVAQVIVNGKAVWSNGHPTLVEASKVYRLAQASHNRMTKRMMVPTNC
ncbi:MAG: 5-methylthioadenosine/S-adenosylhomocysteine deaminase [Parasphingorhabdus sp.]|jgi:5-methylthioadenosine/S-adenosylhomocysteine deaminase